MLRFAVPVVDRRGAGLGNELILWAKAYIAGQALGMTALHPAWSINRRRYWRYFGTSRLDYPAHRLLRLSLPSVRFEEEDYLRHGGGDFADAILAFADERGLLQRSPLVLEIAGLWAGPGMLGLAREFIHGQLLATRWTAGNVFAIDRRVGDDRLRIGVHIRRGDFGSAVDPGRYAGRFNLAVPLAWYEAVLANLHGAFGQDVVFVIASDASPAELAPILERFPCVTTHDLANTDVSDMLALANSDFLVCSISSFSLWAAFLGCMPYAWFAPQLSYFDGMRGIWAHLPAQQQPQSPLGHARDAFKKGAPGRGTTVGLDGRLPDALIADLATALARKRRSNDLIRYGVVA
jgi:hypothetical protein